MRLLRSLRLQQRFFLLVFLLLRLLRLLWLLRLPPFILTFTPGPLVTVGEFTDEFTVLIGEATGEATGEAIGEATGKTAFESFRVRLFAEFESDVSIPETPELFVLISTYAP